MKFLILGLFLGVSACSPLVKFEQPAQTAFVTLESGSTIGQTFMAHYNGLEGVSMYLKPGSAVAGLLRLHLRSSPLATNDLEVASLPVKDIQSPGYYRFRFQPQDGSNKQDFYFFLDFEGSGTIQVGTAAADSYLYGASYQDHLAEDGQLTFRLMYDFNQAIQGLLGEGANWTWLLLVTCLLFVLPGWALFSLLWRGWTSLHWPEKLGLASGLSLALYPLLFMWTDLIGLHLGALYAWLPPLAGAVILIWIHRASFRRSPGRKRWKLSDLKNYTYIGSDLAYLAVLGLIFGVRFWTIRDLEAPMWGDAYQHTMITQLLVDNHGLFHSWQPYAQLATFTYHYGFHTMAAVFYWISRLSIPQAVLWFGQILNGLAVIALYPLASRIGKRQWSGVVGVLLAGLLFNMPMFYSNWGRYTQLAGQAILPAALFISWMLLESEAPRGKDWGLLVLGWLAIGGLALTHYRILIFYIILLATLFLLEIRRGNLASLTIRTFWLGFGAGLLFLPRFIQVYGGSIFRNFTQQVTTPAGQVSEFTQQYNNSGDLANYLPLVIWILLILATGWGLWRREKGAAWIGLGWFLIILAANPGWIALPGAGALSNFAVLIASYIPAGILLGAAFGWLLESGQRIIEEYRAARSAAYRPWPAWVHVLLSASLVIFLVVVGAWGARHRQGDVRPEFGSLFTRPDQRAALWIQNNTSQQANFLVNSLFAYGNAVIAGTDGGWWLPLTARRQSTTPPLNYGTEQGVTPDYRTWINALPAEIQAKGIDDPEVLKTFKERGINYVYIGQRQGRVNNPDGAVLDPEALLASPHYKPVYHQDRVWVFEITP